MRSVSIPTTVHGRVLTEDAADSPAAGLLVLFHGYAQSAEDILAEARRIPGIGAWRLAAIQGLHRFYTRGEQKIVASWMTRQDREIAVADNVAYVDRVLDHITDERQLPNRGSRALDTSLVFLGFSQGASMAYRAAVRGRHRARGVIALAGDIPPELRASTWPATPVLIGAGHDDAWYTPSKVEADLEFLRSRAHPHEVVGFRGGHKWTDEFRIAAGRWLEERK